MEGADLKTVVQNCPLFAKLGTGDRDLLIHYGKTYLFERGENIYEKGARSDGTFSLIVTGRVGVIAESGQIVAGLGPGEIIGEVGVTSPHSKRTVTVRAIADTEVLEWHVKTIQAKLPVVFKRLKDLSWKRVSNYYER